MALTVNMFQSRNRESYLFKLDALAEGQQALNVSIS